jgi:tetratricopeptide (TPR) repeat protein
LGFHSRINKMQSGRTKPLRTIFLGAAVFVGLCATATSSQDAVKPAAKEADSGDKELEPAVAKAREGRVDEALSFIKEKAVKHPEWPPAQVILARVLFSVNQVVAGRRALEQAAAEAGDHPEVYLTLGGTALGDGRFSDALLNFEKALSLIPARRLDAEKTKVFRREALAGLAAVSETREDWKSTQERLTGWLENGSTTRKRSSRKARGFDSRAWHGSWIEDGPPTRGPRSTKPSSSIRA